MPRVNAVDSIMGSGKSTWAHKYINEHKDRRIILCTPFCKEVQRTIEVCPHFRAPKEVDGIPKQADFMRLLENGECIATTHELFKRLPVTPKIIEKLREYGYLLILDEVIEVVEKIEIKAKDLEALFNERYVEMDEHTGVVKWLERDYSGGVFAGYKRLIDTKAVVKYKENLLLWLFPENLLKAFDDIFVLTFLFPGSIMEQYLKIRGFDTELYYIADGQLVKGVQDLSPEKARIRELLEIYDGPLNAVGDKMTAYSATWWKKSGGDSRKRAINDTYNYLRNIRDARAEEILWSQIKVRAKDTPNIKGRWQDAFCSFNARATNEYRDRTVLAYLVNVFIDPGIEAWFGENGGRIDTEQYALSHLLQWVWRSAIREHKKVYLYLPSRRMRELLLNWLANQRG